MMVSVRPSRGLAATAASALILTACATTEKVERLAASVEEKAGALAQSPARQAAFISVADLPEPPEGQITVQLRIRYHGDSLPGGGIRFFEPVPETDGLFAMESLPAGQPVPKGELLEDGILFVTPGDRAKIELVFENPSDDVVAFEALPWFTEPESVHLALTAQCFCVAVPFSAPPGGSLYRTIYIDFGPDIPAGTKMVVTWTVVSDPTQWPLLPGENAEDLIQAIAGGPPAPGAEAEEEEEAAPAEAEVTLEIVGKDIQFDKGRLTVAAATPFTVVFDNRDEDIPHNFAVYESGPPGSGVLSKTEIEAGPVVQELGVEGLPAGTYFYQCDVHPQTMTGTLEVG